MEKKTRAARSQHIVYSFVAAIFLLLAFPSHVAATGLELGLDVGLDHDGLHIDLTGRPLPKLGEVSLLDPSGRLVVDDHTCAKGRPCKNGACCGASGICGYGPAYCGVGCTSDCDAKAECGQFSADGKTTCPLNVCCSAFGFCGTTSEYCDPASGCQSNCGNPSSPGSGGNVRTQIIGYYESWSSYSGRCGSLKPSQIPASALNILNFAFAYISPYTADIIPMVGEDGTSLDSSEAGKLYSQVTAAKFANPNLGVWLAIGGWTFSDNGTEFQPVFGTIAGNSGARQQFARNLVRFMTEYGFDGVDIDWEYPGAPDRGGTKDDYDNFPLLLKDIRQAFNDYGHGNWGISITAPSSYWYLRWFNLPELVKHVDFVNLMSYDLHGIWDQQNEIGSQILAHTNLTEVDRALELFWRNDINPAMINLGVAFYGRTYKLSDSSCRTPGCQFSGPGDKGRCSDKEGYLSYREIMEKIEKAGEKANQIWDKEAGVKMIVYDSNNWISYDDSTTFQQKVDFANQRGLGGLMIWAIDQDDDSFNALQALTNKNVDSTIPENKLMDDFDLSRCYYTECGGECSKQSRGFKEMTRLNLNERGKGCPKSGKNSKQRALCCPPWGAPDPATCHWSKDCGGGCGDGEATLALDDYGDGGYCYFSPKQFCCPASNIAKAVNECEWHFGPDCPSDKPQALTFSGASSLCCPAKPKFKTSTCSWHGDAVSCLRPNCPVGQITVARSSWATLDKGGKTMSIGCYFGGEKSFCCDSPYGADAGGILPVPLDHLFPEYKEIPAADEAVYKEALDGVWSWDIDPDTTPFAWVVMVGPPESVQSLDKRDGSALETFDCPNPDPEDYGVQTFKAVCMAESDDNDCEDLLLGDGAYGTIARLPASCGPDEWVRIVSFREIDNTTLPHHLVKRATPISKVYEIKYDYNLRDVASDEIFVRIDSSTHEHYWKQVVASDLQSKKRSEEDNATKRTGRRDWRDPHMEWFHQHELRKRGAGNSGWWKDLFNGFLKDGATRSSERAEYKFEEVLYQASISCPPSFDASMSARVQGSLLADIDYGVSLIGRVKDTKFEQAFAYFSINELIANAQIYLEGEAQFTFESQEAHLLSNFAPWGGSFNIKGLVTIGPFMDVTAQIDAIATLSGYFGSGVSIANRRIDSGKRSPLTWMYPPSMDVLPDSKALYSGMYPLDTTVEARRQVSVAAQGSVALTLTPSLAFKVKVDINGRLQTDTHITAAFPNRMVIGVGSSTSCSGLQYWMDYEQSFNLITDGSSLGWDKTKKNIYHTSKRMLPPKCYPFTSHTLEPRAADNNATWATHQITARADGNDGEPAVNPLFPDPKGSCLVCATDTFFNDSPCGPLFYENGSEIDPECKATVASPSKKRTEDARSEPMRPEYEANLRWFKERGLIVKRSDKAAFDFCTPMIIVDRLRFPSSGDLLDGNTANLLTYGPLNKGDKYNFEFGLTSTPPRSDSRSWNAEHVLEHQTLKMFLQVVPGIRKSKDGTKYLNAASQDFKDSKTAKKDAWIKADKWDFCQHIKFWLDLIPLRATWYDSRVYEGAFGQTIAKALPNYDKYSEEMMLLDMDTNSVKEAAWNDGVEDVRRVANCLAKEPPEFAKALCSMGKAMYAIRYQQLVQDTLVKQAQRIVDFLDGMEDAAANYNDKDYAVKAYERVGLSGYFKRWMYEHTATAGTKLAGLLNEHLQQMYDRLTNVPQANPGNPAGGGTTTGAHQGNNDLLKQLESLANYYAAYGPWSYEGSENPFEAWKGQPRW